MPPEKQSTYNMAFRLISDIARLTGIMETRANGKEGPGPSNDAKISNLICEVNDSVKGKTKITAKKKSEKTENKNDFSLTKKTIRA